MAKSIEALVIMASKEAYSFTDIISRTMTIGQLIEELSYYPKNTKVVIGNDNGYTYGKITESRINLEEEEDEEDDEE